MRRGGVRSSINSIAAHPAPALGQWEAAPHYSSYASKALPQDDVTSLRECPLQRRPPVLQLYVRLPQPFAFGDRLPLASEPLG